MQFINLFMKSFSIFPFFVSSKNNRGLNQNSETRFSEKDRCELSPKKWLHGFVFK